MLSNCKYTIERTAFSFPQLSVRVCFPSRLSITYIRLPLLRTVRQFIYHDLMTECGSSLRETVISRAKNRYASDQYHAFIGFKGPLVTALGDLLKKRERSFS